MSILCVTVTHTKHFHHPHRVYSSPLPEPTLEEEREVKKGNRTGSVSRLAVQPSPLTLLRLLRSVLEEPDIVNAIMRMFAATLSGVV